MDDDAITIMIGAEPVIVPKIMTFRVLRRVWRHVDRLGRLGQAAQKLQLEEIRLEAGTGSQAEVDEAQARVEKLGADMAGTTDAALALIASAIADRPDAPTFEQLQDRLLTTEIVTLSAGVAELLQASGLRGEALAASQSALPRKSNGIDSSPSSSLMELNPDPGIRSSAA